ncbi:MAG: helix-turn-helix domain-containing protein, partial [Bacteroidota bacterium]
AMTELDIGPIEVRFKHGPPTHLKDYEQAFQCPVLFNQSFYGITYHTADLELRTAKADASIHQFLQDRVEEATKGIEISSFKIATDVEHLIKDALPSGIPSIGRIGEHMGMSSRTLARRLAEHGISFRDLVRQAQEHISKELLQNTNQTISEIAFQTGFSEQSAFSRAFKRWTGKAPLEFRNS